MVAPPSILELSRIKVASSLAASEAVQKQCEKRKQLLAANKLAARALLLSISSSYSTAVVKDK